jgi:hypothetical protein
MSPALLSSIQENINRAFRNWCTDQKRERIGGALHGHLNCFPGQQAAAFDLEIERLGIKKLMEDLVGEPVMLVSAGCNINLPGSRAQNFHIDGEFDQPLLVVNATLVDTDAHNGATEIVPGTHKSELLYWEFMLKGFFGRRSRIESRVGDILVRPTTLWHRGMPNLSGSIRPMLGFVYAPVSRALEPEEYTTANGAIALIPNRYSSSLKGRIAETMATYVPFAMAALRIMRSFSLKKGQVAH